MAGRGVTVEEGKHGQEMGQERGSGAAGRAAGKERERCRKEVGWEERNGRNRGEGEGPVRRRVWRPVSDGHGSVAEMRSVGGCREKCRVRRERLGAAWCSRRRMGNVEDR